MVQDLSWGPGTRASDGIFWRDGGYRDGWWRGCMTGHVILRFQWKPWPTNARTVLKWVSLKWIKMEFQHGWFLVMVEVVFLFDVTVVIFRLDVEFAWFDYGIHAVTHTHILLIFLVCMHSSKFECWVVFFYFPHEWLKRSFEKERKNPPEIGPSSCELLLI